MGRTFFGVDIQHELASVMAPGTMPAFTLVKGANSYETRGNMGQFSYDEMEKDRSIQKGDQKVVLVAEPLDQVGVEPKPITDYLLDDAGKRYTIVSARTNSARAVWICQCRG